ncbi:DUF952 domain-containing protein [Haloarculaceae archaeon H-GB2-1]|nr:DUF952 domain-containing protein [Haloarculaceae archaeon H-GB1-1]MEA5386350.1 DUF952 domain-containing protein [Haloarculaceae archaeon H-GB11]MEA5407853.1 DUF952 domain-containing protein [Haloarculaceae archaeon H-GB2-1]
MFHVVEADRWAEHDADDPYAPDSLDEEGFVHAATNETVQWVGQQFYADADDPRLLVLDREALDAEVRYESGRDGAFPHVYGEIDADAIVDVIQFERDEAGRYVRPERDSP